MDAITLLREDHEKVLAMLAELAAGPASKATVTELVIAESQHEAVEEQFFWPMVRSSLPDGDELANQAVSQENAAKQVLHALEHAQPDQSDFQEMVNRIVTEGREHIEFEQTQVWPKVRETVSEQELAELGEKMAKAKKTAPTRPHPDTPASPGVLKTAGAAAAMTDKLRDAVSGRRRHK